MSRLDVNAIRHTDGSADNITLDGSKNVTCENNLQVDGNLTVTGTIPADKLTGTAAAINGSNITNLPAANLTGTLPAISGANLTNLPASGVNPNILHNPAFQVWQRGVTLTGCEVDTYTADRWKQWGGAGGQSGRATYERSTDVPDSVATVESMKISCTTTETPGASEGYMIMQRLEGRDTHHLQWGTSNAKAVTISFWCKGDAAKTYTLSIFRSSSTDRTFTKTFNVTTSWSKVTITVPGDTSAAHSDITQNSQINWKVMVGISLMQGTQSATDNSWQNSGSGKYAVSGNDNFFESTDRRLYLAAMKMEIGSSATDFEQPDATLEQKRCERYLEYVVRGNNDPIITGALFAGDMVTGVIPFRTMKRTTSPSMISAGGTDYLRLRYTYTGTGANNTIDGDNFNLQYKSETAAGVWFTGFDIGNNTTMGAGGLLYAINADVRLAFSSEL